jgi:hypothetical protein
MVLARAVVLLKYAVAAVVLNSTSSSNRTCFCGHPYIGFPAARIFTALLPEALCFRDFRASGAFLTPYFGGVFKGEF